MTAKRRPCERSFEETSRQETLSLFGTKARAADPGCARCSHRLAPSWDAGSVRKLALVTDGRFSGGTHGFVVGHITPEAFDGGPLAIVEEWRYDHDRRGKADY